MIVEPIRDKKKINDLLIFLKGQSKRDWLLCKFQLNTGLRISDVVKIRVSDLLNENMRFKEYFILNEQKTGKEKKIKLNKEIKSAVKSYVEESNYTVNDYIFTSKKGGYIGTVQAYRILKNAANSVNIENFGTHSLRKSWGILDI